jgi:AcrR family transcriptional regulator
VRRRHSREGLLAAAVAVGMRDGLQGLTFAAVARQADVADRTVVYYFTTKDDMVVAVVDVMAARLQSRLATSIGDDRFPPEALLRRAWRVVDDADARAVVRVWLEMCVHAAANEAPYAEASQRIAQAWLTWLTDHVEGPTLPSRRTIASALLARLDGALLLEMIGLPKTAARAVGA